jgi:RNA exonuclease 4
VNDQGNVLMDKYVQQKEKVRDYRTQWSGIRPEDVHSSKAEPFAIVQKEAADLFKDRVIVGHAIQNDLKVRLHPIAYMPHAIRLLSS